MYMKFNPPPGWPQAPAGWTPPRGWRPNPAWPSAPKGWPFWIPLAASPAIRSDPLPRRDEPPSGPRRGKPARTSEGGVRWFLAKASVAFAAVALVYAIVSGQSVDKISPDGVFFHNPVPQSSASGQQTEMESRIQDQENKVNAAPSPASTTDVNFGGVWTGGTGCDYVIHQVQASATLQVVCQYQESPWAPLVDVITVYGEGVVKGSVFAFRYYAVDGTMGTGTFTLRGNTIQIDAVVVPMTGSSASGVLTLRNR